MCATRGIGLLVLVGCGEPLPSGPPQLPGELNPPCDLVSESFLVGGVTTPDDVLVDLSVPPDGNADSNQFPGLELQCFGSPLVDAIQRAFSSRHILWLLTIDKCADAVTPYARITLERGESASTTSPPEVVVVSDDTVPAVGTVSGTSYDV